MVSKSLRDLLEKQVDEGAFFRVSRDDILERNGLVIKILLGGFDTV